MFFSEVLLEKENEMAESFDRIDQKIRKIKFAKDTDPNTLKALEGKKTRIYETIRFKLILKFDFLYFKKESMRIWKRAIRKSFLNMKK